MVSNFGRNIPTELVQQKGVKKLTQDGKEHWGVYPGTTWSPGTTDVTPGPTDSTMAPASWPRMEGKSPVITKKSGHKQNKEE